MIVITETADEFLIAIAYAQRDRAKRIAGYRWDPGNKVWRFRNTPETKRQIFQEFGPDEVEWTSADSRGSRSETGLPVGADEDSKIAEAQRIAAEAIDLAAAANTSTQEAHDQAVRLASNFEALAEQARLACGYLKRIQESAEAHGFPEDGELDDLVGFADASFSEHGFQSDLVVRVATLEAELKAARAEASALREAAGIGSPADLATVISRSVWSLESVPIPKVVEEYTLDHRGPIELQNHLHKLLRNRLNHGNERVAFAELIREAEDAKVLTEGGVRMCHTLRVQRNAFAHTTLAPADVPAQAALCLIAFLLVYKELIDPREPQ